ncbi:MAG: ABC transporter permease [Phycisphaerales bacterium]|nr:ABC transporter permease [Phycisphaerales bacterium]
MKVGALARSVGPLVGLIFVWVLFAVLNGGSFVQWSNQRLMLTQTAVVGTAAIGATLIIIAGGIDLSVGSTIALGTVVVGLLLDAGEPPLVAALGGIGAAMVCGLIIGTLVIGRLGGALTVIAGAILTGWLWARLGAPMPAAVGAGAVAATGLALLVRRFDARLPLAPFIVTLGMWGALRGLAKGLADNGQVHPPDATWVGGLLDRATVLPTGVWMFLGLALITGAALRYTRFGRHVYAIGSNEQTARLCGVRVERTKVWIYILGIGCAGLAALMQFSYLKAGDPTTAEGYELKVIAAVVIGGASLSGGEGTIRGTIIGALIMTVVDSGCTHLGIDNWVQEIVTGAMIVAAVALDRIRHRRAT